MLARAFPFVGTMLLLGICGCGDDQKQASASDVFGGSGAGSTSGTEGPTLQFCRDFCAVIVSTGTDCAHYNDGGRCAQICTFYMSGGCSAEYQAYAECMQGSTQISCFLADSGKWGVNIVDCTSQFDVFNTCTEERDAGVCPY